MIPRNKCLLIITICIFLYLVNIANAIETDKQKHFAVSFGAGSVSTIIVGEYMPDSKWYTKTGIAFLIGMIPGIVKEACDSRSGGSGWDNEDLLADALGVSTGIISFSWTW